MSKFMKLNTLKVGILSSLMILFLYSCEVEKVEPSNPLPTPDEVIDKKPDSVNIGRPSQDESLNQNAIVIGNGSGYLILKDSKDKNYSIKAGTYSGVNLSNLQNVKITGGTIDIGNVDGVTLSDLSIENHNQAAIYVHTSADNLTLKNLKLKNISNYGIRYDINKKYDGSPQSFSENIHLENIQAEN